MRLNRHNCRKVASYVIGSGAVLVMLLILLAAGAIMAWAGDSIMGERSARAQVAHEKAKAEKIGPWVALFFTKNSQILVIGDDDGPIEYHPFVLEEEPTTSRVNAVGRPQSHIVVLDQRYRPNEVAY